MKIIAVVAADLNNAIGKDNMIPWYLPDDFKFFKKQTLGHPIIMGRNTFESIGKVLPGRENIVISTTMPNQEDITLFRNIEDSITYCHEHNESKISIIGGGVIFEKTKHIWDEIIFTKVNTKVEDATVFFPEINEDLWELAWEEFHATDVKHLYEFTFQRWLRKKRN